MLFRLPLEHKNVKTNTVSLTNSVFHYYLWPIQVKMANSDSTVERLSTYFVSIYRQLIYRGISQTYHSSVKNKLLKSK